MKPEDVIKKVDELSVDLSNQVDKALLKARKKELLKNYEGKDMVVSWKDIEEQVKAEGEPERLVTGLTTFDKALRGGIERGRLISLSASSKSGKTSFCIDLMRKLERYYPLIISLEQPAKELVREQMLYKNEVPDIFSPKSFTKVTMSWLEERMIESFLKFGTKVTVIDHLDFIEKNPKLRTKHEQIQEVMEELILLARRLKMTIFIISHINKLPPDEKPTYFHLAESSSTYKLSDITLMLWRECEKIGRNIEYTGMVNLCIELSRQGGGGENIKLVFDKGKYHEAHPMETMEADDKMTALKNLKKEKAF